MNQNQNKASKENLSTWSKFPLGETRSSVPSSASVLINHHWITITQTYNKPATLVAVDLNDYIAQEVKVPESMFYYHEKYTLTTYKDNQIIKYGGLKFNNPIEDLVRITIESFEPLKVKCEKIESHENPKRSGHTAHIYQDSLYVYGGSGDMPTNKLLKFDLNTLVWTEYKPLGEGPGLRSCTSSFLLENSLYVYGGSRGSFDSSLQNIFSVNLSESSMTWNKLEQKVPYLANRNCINGDIYKNYLLFLGGQDSLHHETLYCWNIEGNSWSTFEIQKPEGWRRSNLVVYRNKLLAFYDNSKGQFLLTFDLNKVSLPNLKSLLFLNEEGSDVVFKVQDRMIPAHKHILTEKSKFFANLFKSGMIESRQNVIEVPDCEHLVFQEFLRFLYCDRTKLQEDLAMKLLIFADKHLQDDLYKQCKTFFVQNLNSENLYRILNFASEQDLSHVKDHCVRFFKKSINEENVSGFIRHLDTQPDPESALEIVIENLGKRSIIQFAKLMYKEKGNERLKKFIFDFAKKHFKELQEMILTDDFPKRFVVEFLSTISESALETFLENLGTDAVVKFAQLVYKEKGDERLRKVLFDFAQKHFKKLQGIMLTDFPSRFVIEFVSSMVEKVNKYELNEKQVLAEELLQLQIDNGSSTQLQKGRKRKDPVQEDIQEEKPELKKTKKSD